MISEVDKFLHTNTVYKNIPISLDFSRPRNPMISDASDSNRLVESSTEEIMDNYSMK